MKLGLALSSGGARGLSHIGVIRVLQKHGVKIDYVAGTSVGAIVACYFALHGNVDGLFRYAKKLNRRKILSLIDLNNPRISLIKGEKIRKELYGIFGDKKFDDTIMPVKVGATALETGKQVILDKGPLLDAILISATFPGVFAPKEYKGQHLVDGGLSDATPVKLVKKMGADRVIAVDLFNLETIKSSDFGIKETMLRTYEVMACNLSKYKAAKYGKNIIVLKPKAGKRTETFSFFNANKYIKAGETEAHKNIKQIMRLIR
jgi:NTE family protein